MAQRRVRQALLPAASRLTTADSDSSPRQIIRVDGTPVIIYLLRTLSRLGFERAVLTLGHKGSQIAAAVEDESFGDMTVHFVWCETTYSRGHAANMMAARAMFLSTEPFLVIMSDHLFEPRLLARLAEAPMEADTDAVALVDDTEETLQWMTVDHCAAFCVNGHHCQKLVKVLKGCDGLLVRIGKRIQDYDGLEAGAYLVRPAIFETLGKLLQQTTYTTLADAMGLLAAKGRLRFESTAGLTWFSELVVASLQQPDFVSKAVRPGWRAQAKALMANFRAAGEPLPTGDATAATDAGGGGGRGVEGGGSRSGMKRVPTLITLGDTIGEGASSVVMEVQVTRPGGAPRADFGGGASGSFGACLDRTGSGGALGSPGGTDGRGAKVGGSELQLAVKMVRHRGGVDDDQEQLAMWEMHVLQQLFHPHIVHVRDVIDLVDATYIVMERVDGPELGELIACSPGGRLCPDKACKYLAHMLAALRHAHRVGFLHCDIKPSNIRLAQPRDHAVVTDWGFARKLGATPSCAAMYGTPAYAPPEQLTGYSCDGLSGARRLSGESDVWSLGCTAHEMLTGRPPFAGDNLDTLVRNVIGLNYHCPFPDDVPRQAISLVHSCLQVCAIDRASIDELCDNAWVVASGHLPPADPAEHEVHVRFNTCGPCETGGPPKGNGFPVLNRLQGRGLMALYLGLCVFALVSHMVYGPHEGASFTLE